MSIKYLTAKEISEELGCSLSVVAGTARGMAS